MMPAVQLFHRSLAALFFFFFFCPRHQPILPSGSMPPLSVPEKPSPGLSKLLNDMKCLLSDSRSSDVTFLTERDEREDEILTAHRLILSLRCSAFDREIGSSVCRIPGATISMTGSVIRIKWPRVCHKTLRDVLTYLYTGLIEIADNNVFHVLAIAHDMGIAELSEQSKRYIRENLSVGNACVFLPEALRQSKRWNGGDENQEFLQHCIDFIGENASQCLSSSAFLQMDKESVTHVIASDSLAMGEEDIWRSVLSWARGKAGVSGPGQQWSDDERKRMASLLSGVIEHVRILQIDSQVFAEEVEPTGVVPIQISLERYRFAALPDKFKNSVTDIRFKPRSHCKLFDGSKIMSGSRSNLQKVLNSMYGVEKQSWKLVFRASTNGFSAAAFHRHCDGQENTMTVVLASNGHVCAGFTDAAWFTSKTSLGKCVTSEKSFLCSLWSTNSRPMRFDVKRKSFALIHHPDHGPIFGAAPDLLISDNCNANNKSISFVGHSYDGGNAPTNALLGENYFSVADYEVFVPCS